MTQKSGHSESFAAFMLSFFVTLLLLLGTLSAAILWQQRQVSRTAEADEYAGPGTVFLPRKEDRLLMLATLAEDKETSPECYLLAGFLPDKGRIALCMLPPKTMLTVGDQWGTLDEMYERGGTSYAAKAVGSSLGLTIDRYAAMEVSGLKKLMESAGFFDYYLPLELDYPLHQRQIAMSRGPQQLDGRKVADIIFYPAYKGGETERSDRGVMLLTEMLNTHMPDFLTSQGDALVKSFLSSSESNISWQDFEERRQATEFLAQLSMPAVSAVYVEGQLSADYHSFLLTESCRARLFSVFGGDGFPVTSHEGKANVHLEAYDRVEGQSKPQPSDK